MAIPPPPANRNAALSAVRGADYWFNASARTDEPQEDSVYVEEAVPLLEDSFLWLSCADIQSAFRAAGGRFALAWKELDDADANGHKASSPLMALDVPRASKGFVSEDGSVVPLRNKLLEEEFRFVQSVQRRRDSEFICWADSLYFSLDRNGEEQLLDVDGAQVMMAWERLYMERCVEVLGISGDSRVLEVGFGCGYSANWIQRFKPREHVIIECADQVLKRLHTWAAERPSVTVVAGTWQEKLPELGAFDCIFFDDYGTPGRSDREMKEFCPNPLYREQYSRALEAEHGSHFNAFVSIALRWHCRLGARISGYLEHPVQLRRRDVETHYEHVAVAPPPHCNYFPGELWPRALVPLFIKRGARSRRLGAPGAHGRKGHLVHRAWKVVSKGFFAKVRGLGKREGLQRRVSDLSCTAVQV